MSIFGHHAPGPLVFGPLVLALIFERVAGYPSWLFRLIGHPVTWMGALISRLDQAFNREGFSFEKRRKAGILALVILLAATLMAAFPLVIAAALAPFAGLLFFVPASTLIAAKSLDRHVLAVADALDSKGLGAGRAAVSQIVGRNPATLDEHGVASAAIESLAENFSDGVVAPSLWLDLLGLPGGALYKAINTADSMIGHRTPRHEAFGWASARLDDWVNWPASRLTALLFVSAAWILPDANGRASWRAVWRDARRHRSLNAGWPEAAMAGALGLKLAGPRFYGDIKVDDAFMGDGRCNATTLDIRRALRLSHVAWWLQVGLAMAILSLVFKMQGSAAPLY